GQIAALGHWAYGFDGAGGPGGASPTWASDPALAASARATSMMSALGGPAPPRVTLTPLAVSTCSAEAIGGPAASRAACGTSCAADFGGAGAASTLATAN